MKILRIYFLLVLVISVSCDDEEEPQSRTYLMGFQNSAPEFGNFDMFIQSLNMWTTRADAAFINTEVPWEKFLAGEDPVDFVVANYKDLVIFYRNKNFKLW